MIVRLVLALFVSHCLGIFADADTTPAPVPKTGQTTCRKRIVVIPCAGTGQDGDTLAGVPWPVPRFADNGDQTITDMLTGLTWTREANLAGDYRTWQQALDYMKTLNSRKHLGHDDWRLPNINELESLVNKQPRLASWLTSQGFHDVQVDYYWTSSTYANYPTHAWNVGTYSGIVAGRAKGDAAYLWPVRGGRSGASPVPKTGQIACYDPYGTVLECPGTGQDGELQAGADWPSPRFADNEDQTVTDQLTGLVWSGEANAPGPTVCNPGAARVWQDALDYVGCLNANHFLGKNDWRLPNRNELASLLNRGQPNSATWLNAQAFANAQTSSYWSSSNYSCAAQNAWAINLHDGAVTSAPKKNPNHVWPVRNSR